MLNKLHRSVFLKSAVLLALIIRAESTILLDCDPLGTLWRMSSINHCICRPYFYGVFCHRIRRCVSGKPVPVNCTNSEKRYVQHASQRCTSAKTFVDMCECFEGYTGPLCERFSANSYSGYGSPSKQAQQVHISSLTRTEKSMLVEQGDLQFYRSTQWIIFFILHLVLVIMGIASVSLAMICYHRHTRLREERFDAYRSNGYEVVVPQMQSNDYNKTYHFPPKYEEITEEHENFEFTKVQRCYEVESTPYIMRKHASYHKPLNTTSERKSIHLHV